MSPRRTKPPFQMSAEQYRGTATEEQWRATIKEAAGYHGWDLLLELPDSGLGKLAQLANGSPKKGPDGRRAPTHKPMTWLLGFLAAVSGWPDLTFGHREQKRLLFVEAKIPGKDPRPNQKIVLALLRECGQEVVVWRTGDELNEVLAGR